MYIPVWIERKNAHIHCTGRSSLAVDTDSSIILDWLDHELNM